MSDRYLNTEESRQVREFVDQYSTNPPADADSVLDDLDRSILKSEGLSTIENVNALLTTRALEAQQRGERSSVPTRVLQSIAADDAMADLDDCLWQGVRDQAGPTEDGGWGHLDKVVEEIEAGHKARQKDEARAARERASTAKRFMGTSFDPKKGIPAEQFERGKRR
jgi:hypothetical protein